MKNKKGAFQLSVTTIVVIVIAVVLLSLGLVFVRGIFNKMDFLTLDAFETADAEIGKLSNIDEPLTLTPGTIQIEQGGAKEVRLIIANFEDSDATFQAEISSTSNDVICVFADTKESTSKEYNLNSGDQASIKILIDEKGGPLTTEVCNIEIDGLSGDNREELIINIVKA